MANEIAHNRNEDATVRVTVQNPDRTAYNLTGATVKLMVKTNRDDPDAKALFSKTVNETPAAAGQIVLPATLGLVDFYVLPADTLALPVWVAPISPRTVVFAVMVKTAAGKRYTVVDGTYKVFQQFMDPF